MTNQFEIIRLTPEEMNQAEDEMMGTKAKFWIQHRQLGCCLFKYSRQNTGEDWSEKFAFELCKLLDLPSAQYELAEDANGERGIIATNFLSQGETLVHGNEILSKIIPNYPISTTYKAYQHTVRTVMEAIRRDCVTFPRNWTVPNNFSDPRDLFIGYLLLDAWIGNNDRHHENWGFVRLQNTPESTYLAPSYDHASCLGRDLSDLQRQRRSVEAYTKKCTLAFYLNEGERKPLKTIELFRHLTSQYPQASQEWLDRLEQISPQQIDSIIQAFPPNRLSQVAGEFAKEILRINQERLLSL